MRLPPSFVSISLRIRNLGEKVSVKLVKKVHYEEKNEFS